MTPARATHSLSEFKAALPHTGRLLGLDVGSDTIGMALSDPSRMIATPDHTRMRTKWSEDVAVLMAQIAQHEVVGIVMGYPLNMDGSSGPRAQATRAFARNLAQHVTLPILLWDERLSTAAVTRMMEKEADLSRSRRDALVDKLAASYILQGVLDGLTGMV